MNPIRFSRRNRWLLALGLVLAVAAGAFAYTDGAVLGDIRQTFSTVRASSMDAALEATVRSALALSRRASGLDLEVEARAGTVTLSGKVPTAEVGAIAAAIVADTPGVSAVDDRLEIDARAVANGYEAALVQRIADLETQVSLQERLRREPLLAAARLKVEVAQGRVLLSGAVETEVERDAALQMARAAVGAEQVRDELHVLAPERGGDVALARRVEFELYSTGAFDLEPIAIGSEAGRVRLEGEVRSEAERLLAARLAEGVPGVRAVVNQLVVGDALE
jgi:osmotically-inducible protein OsmY